MTVNGNIKVRFLGIFKKAYGSDKVTIELRSGEKLRDIIRKLTESSPELKRVLIDPELNDPRPNAIILVCGKEINVLKGLETEVKDNSEIVLVPVTHGG